MKTCITCKIVKPESDFFFRNKSKGYRQSRCKPCFVAINNAMKKKNPDQTKAIKRREYIKNKARYRNNNLMLEYGITLERYNEMLVLQDGACDICGNPPSVRALDVDHCHASGKVRGLLCNSCNRLLSNCNDSIEILNQAIAYLLK